MEDLFELQSTQITPYVRLDAVSGTLEFAGSSLPENPLSVYAPVLEWLEGYVQRPAARTELSLRFTYYNTTSSKMLLMVFKHLEDVLRKGLEVEVRWYFQAGDEDMEEAGYEFAEGTLLPFTYIAE